MQYGEWSTSKSDEGVPTVSYGERGSRNMTELINHNLVFKRVQWVAKLQNGPEAKTRKP